MIRFTLFLSAVGFILCGQLSNIRFYHLSLNEGLSNSQVTSILQDSKGFIWIGTLDGLNKYDGYSFVVYKNDPLDIHSIQDNYIRAIAEDEKGNLWIGTENGGLYKFDPVRETFSHYGHDPENNNTLGYDSVSIIYFDPSNNILWIGTNGGGLDRFDPRSGAFTHFKNEKGNVHSLSSNSIRSIQKDRFGNLWVGTPDGLNKLSGGSNKTCERFYNDPMKKNTVCSSDIYSILSDRDGNLWFGTTDGISLLSDPDSGKFISYNEKKFHGFQGDDVQVMLEDNTGMLWIGTFHGLKKFNREKKIFTSYRSNSGDPYSLNENNVRCLFMDQSGLLWIGTNGGGINILNSEQKFFKLYTNEHGNANSISDSGVRGIYEDQDGILWVGGYAGLNKIDRQSGRVIHYRAGDNTGHPLSTDLIFSITGDPENKDILWIGSEGDGLYRFNKITRKTKHYIKNDVADASALNILSNNFIFDLHFDEKGILWIATGDGLDALNIATNEITIYRHDPGDPHSVSSNEIRVIYEDREGRLWVGTRTNGLNRFDPESKQFKRFTHDPTNPSSISNNRIDCIYQDTKETLWIGTNGGGLNRFLNETETFRYYTEKDGLPNDVIYGILEDENGNLWISTNNGLSEFSPYAELKDEKRNRFRNFNTYDGLQSNEFNSSSYYKSQTGEMFFGGINGFNSFYPEEIKEDDFQPKVVITDFKIYNHSIHPGFSLNDRIILSQNISYTKKITLSRKENIISFDFAVMSFYVPKNNEYSYKLEGFNSDWVDANRTGRTATYTNLSPGKYVFRVRGADHYRQWSQNEASIELVVKPSWYETKLAITFYIISLLIIGPSIFFLQVNRLKKKARQQQQIIHNLKIIDELKAETIKSQEKYKTIVETSHDIILMIDKDDNIVFNNKRFSEVLRATSKTNLKNKWSEFIHPDAVKHYNEKRTEVITRKQHRAFELKMKSDSGKEMYLLVSLIPVEENGDFKGIMIFGLDITDRVRAEKALSEKTIYLDNILASATEYAIATTDLDFRITYYNPMAEKIHGYKAEEVIGKTVQQVHTKENVSPGRFEKAIENIRRFGEHCYIVEKETDDGTHYFDTRVSGIYNASGELVGYANFARDITEQKATEENIQKLTRAVEQSASMVIITDTIGNIEYVNKRFTEITGFTQDEAVGEKPSILKSGDQPDDFYKNLWNTIISGKEWTGEIKNRKKNGGHFWVLCSISPVKDPTGQIIHFVGIEEDITAERMAREEFARQLIDSQEQERKRIANEMHDALGQDLIIIKNTALLGMVSNSDISEKTTRLKEISDTASIVIEDIRRIARYLSPYQLDRLGLSKALESIPDTINKTTKIRFSHMIEPIDGLFPSENEIHIFRILQESVNNIVKHSGCTEAMVIVKKQPESVRLIIKDDGRGFNAAAFMPGAKLKQGFGLYGIKERVGILGGSMDIKSQPGMGTSIIITLPFIKKAGNNEK